MIMTKTWIVCADCGKASRIVENVKGTQLRRDLEKEGWAYSNGTDRCECCMTKHRAYLSKLGNRGGGKVPGNGH